MASLFGISVPPLRLDPCPAQPATCRASPASTHGPTGGWRSRPPGAACCIASEEGETEALPLDERTFLVDAADPDNPTVTFGAFDADGPAAGALRHAVGTAPCRRVSAVGPPESWEDRPVHIDVNGTRLWFDVDGPALVPDGAEMRQRPTVVLVHGGPGVYDHSYFKPDFGRLAEHAQVVYLDLRGHGRSDWGERRRRGASRRAPTTSAPSATRPEIARPIVLGHSMGGPIVLLYGARHPGHAAGLVVQSGFARWDPPRMVDGFPPRRRRRGRGDRAAQLRRRVGARRAVGRVFAAFGPHLPDEEREAHTPQNLELNSHGMELIRGSTSSISSARSTRRRSSRSASSTRSPRSRPPRRSSARCPKASRSSTCSREQATSRGWTPPSATGRCRRLRGARSGAQAGAGLRSGRMWVCPTWSC